MRSFAGRVFRYAVATARYFFGNLRVLLLSEFAAVRALCLAPGGNRISGAIKIEKDPDELINELRIKPKRAGGPGRNAKYAYSDALISLIDDARLSALDMNNRTAAIRAIKKWLSEWFEEHADETGDVPCGDLLAPYAEKICVHSDRARSGTIGRAHRQPDWARIHSHIYSSSNVSNSNYAPLHCT